MIEKRLLIASALVVSTVAVGTIYLFSDKNTSQLAISANPVSYSATIDASHPLYATDSSDYFAFGLHNAGAYGGLRPVEGGTLGFNLPEGYKDYAFSWTAPASMYFQIFIKNWDMKCRIGGVEHTLWGIPGAYKVELVYNKGGASYSVNGIPYYNWAKKSEVVDPVTKDVTVTYEDTNSSGDNTYWSVSMSESSTMYVRSMTIWYTCG